MTTMTDSIGLQLPTRPPAAPVAAVPVETAAGRPVEDRHLEGRPLYVPTGETRAERWRWFALMLIVTAMYGFMTFSFYAPADGGIDQNAYLVGGRQLAEHGTDKFTLANPYAYVGGMMVRVSPVNVNGGDYYPKYPVGLPLLYAMFFWGFKLAAMLPYVGAHVDPNLAPVWAFWVSPGSAVLAFFGTYLLGRAIHSSFAGFIAAILVATSRLTMELSIDAKSHSADMAVVVWGIYLLVRWWQTGSVWRGVLAGLLIGFSTSIRYTEGLLVLPILIAVASRFRLAHLTRSFLPAGVFACLLGYSGACLVTGLFRTDPHLLPAKYYQYMDVERHGHLQVAVGWAVLLIGVASVAAAFLLSDRGPTGESPDNPRSSKLWGIASPQVWCATAGGLAAVALFARLAEYRPFGAWQQVLGVLMILAGIAGLAAAGVVAWRENWIPTFRELVPLLAWLVPVAALAIFNLSTMGTLTGYDATNESEGFQFSKFLDTFEHMFRTYYTYATYFVMPLSILGVGVLFRKNWKLALVMIAWVVPSSSLYAAYYWSPDSAGNAYSRFFLSFVPAVMVTAAVFLVDWTKPAELAGSVVAGSGRRWGRTVVVGCVVALSAAIPVYEMCYGFQSGMKEGRGGGRGGFGGGGGMQTNTIAEDNRNRVNLAAIGQLAMKVPEHSVLFISNGGGRGMGARIDNAMNYVQFLKPWALFEADAFDAPGGGENGFGFGGGGGGGRNRGGGGGRFGGNQAVDPNNVIGAQPQQYLQTEYSSRIHSDRATAELALLTAKDTPSATVKNLIEQIVPRDYPKTTAESILADYRRGRTGTSTLVSKIVQREFDLAESDMLTKEMSEGHGVWILASSSQIESIESRVVAHIGLRSDGPESQKQKYDWEPQGYWTDLPATTGVESWTDQKLFTFLMHKPDPQAIPDAKEIAEENAKDSGHRPRRTSLGSTSGRRSGNARRNGGGGGAGGPGGFAGGPPGMGGIGGPETATANTVWELVKLVPAKPGAKPKPTVPSDDEMDGRGF
jgi:hypothetical protein